jgi:hypothetical protein
MFRPLHDRRYSASRCSSAWLLLVAICVLSIAALFALLKTVFGIVLGVALDAYALVYGYSKAASFSGMQHHHLKMLTGEATPQIPDLSDFAALCPKLPRNCTP